MSSQDRSNNDFFQILEQEKVESDPFASDEIIFRDADGRLKVLKNGSVLDFTRLEDNQASEEKNALSRQSPPTVKPARRYDLDAEVEKVMAEIAMKLADAELEKRFKNIVRSYLRGIRNRVQTKETFLSSMLDGGMGFDSQTTDRIFSIMSKHAARLHQESHEAVEPEPFSNLKAEVDALLKVPKHIPSTPPTTRQLKPATFKQPQQRPAPPPPEQAAPQPPAAASQPLVRPPAPTKPKIEDITFESKLTGPVEEIRLMSLTDFRRLAPDPEQAIQKIIEKINILEEESFTKKTQATRAWKEGKVNQIYLELGRQSMEEKKPIADVIAEKEARGEPMLSEAEVEAINELNRRLRY